MSESGLKKVWEILNTPIGQKAADQEVKDESVVGSASQEPTKEVSTQIQDINPESDEEDQAGMLQRVWRTLNEPIRFGSSSEVSESVDMDLSASPESASEKSSERDLPDLSHLQPDLDADETIDNEVPVMDVDPSHEGHKSEDQGEDVVAQDESVVNQDEAMDIEQDEELDIVSSEPEPTDDISSETDDAALATLLNAEMSSLEVQSEDEGLDSINEAQPDLSDPISDLKENVSEESDVEEWGTTEDDVTSELVEADTESSASEEWGLDDDHVASESLEDNIDDRLNEQEDVVLSSDDEHTEKTQVLSANDTSEHVVDLNIDHPILGIQESSRREIERFVSSVDTGLFVSQFHHQYRRKEKNSPILEPVVLTSFPDPED